MELADLVQVLEKTNVPDQSQLVLAQHYLQQAAEQNLPGLLVRLSEALRDSQNSLVVRTQAGIQLKSALHSKDSATRELYVRRWLTLAPETRNQIKQNCLATLGTEQQRPSTAAQCVAHIAFAELPVGEWNGVLERLTVNVTASDSQAPLREAALEAIGYICADLPSGLVADASNAILTAIVHGMRKDEPSDAVRLAATNALLNSLEFTRSNFENVTERNVIMQVVCEATQSASVQVRVASLQCIAKIVSLYYAHMECYMQAALFAISLEAIRSDVDEVALQGIEFWSSICDEELELAMEASEAAEQGRPPSRVSRHYAKGALQYVVPILCDLLSKQIESEDEDDWNRSKAAAVCLGLLTNCTEDAMVPHVLPFVQENISSANWRQRDAALVAFGSILEGPDPKTLEPLVVEAMPLLVALLKDSAVGVRDSAAWCIEKVCECLPEVAVRDVYLVQLLPALVDGLAAETRVATNVCWALSSLAEAAFEAVNDSQDGANSTQDPATFALSAYFDAIVERLLWTADRTDAGSHNLRNAAYEALMDLLKYSPRDCYSTVQKAIMVVLTKLQGLLSLAESHSSLSGSDRSQLQDLQSSLCATLQSVLRKISREDAPKVSDAVVACLLQILSVSAASSDSGVGVQEDALLALSTLVETLGDQFLKYMDATKPFLVRSLQNHADNQVCIAAVGLTGDLCRALGAAVIVHCDELMLLLLDALRSSVVHNSVKPHILSAFGDIALAVGDAFCKYLDVVMATLAQAAAMQVDRNDVDMLDYLAELRDGCFEGYTGVLQGVRGDASIAADAAKQAQLVALLGHIEPAVLLIEAIAEDSERTESNVANAVGLIGDLVTLFSSSVAPLVERERVQAVIQIAKKSKSSKTRALASWTQKEIRKLRQAATVQPEFANSFASAPAAGREQPQLNLANLLA